MKGRRSKLYTFKSSESMQSYFAMWGYTYLFRFTSIISDSYDFFSNNIFFENL